MDAHRTGRFICILRKQRGMTQGQLAGEIGVTDKAVSRWETGKGLPDVTLLEPLAAALGVSVGELVAGEPLTEKERADRALLEAMRYAGGMGRRVAALLLAMAGIWLLALPLFLAAGGRWSWVLRIAGGVLLVLAWTVRRRSGLPARWGGVAVWLRKRRSARLCAGICFAAALALEIPPWGAVLRFGQMGENGEIQFVRETYSYFSLLPLGYANGFPLLTGGMTVLLLALSIARFRRERPGNGLFLLGTAAVAVSVLPAVFGVEFLSAAGLCITLALSAGTGFLALANRNGEP